LKQGNWLSHVHEDGEGDSGDSSGHGGGGILSSLGAVNIAGSSPDTSILGSIEGDETSGRSLLAGNWVPVFSSSFGDFVNVLADIVAFGLGVSDNLNARNLTSGICPVCSGQAINCGEAGCGVDIGGGSLNLNWS